MHDHAFRSVKFISTMVWLVAMYVVVTYVSLVMLGLAQIHVSHGPKAGQIFQEVATLDRVTAERRNRLHELRVQKDEFTATLNGERTKLMELAIASGIPEEKYNPVLNGRGADAIDGSKVDLVRWARLASSIRGWSNSLEQTDAAIENVEATLVGTDGDLLDHVKGVASGKSQADEELDRVRYTVRALRDMIIFNQKVIFLPVEVLTLLLTLTMGALGSTLHATRVLVDRVKAGTDDDAPLRWFFFRPFQGMITACVVYIVLKAGQVTISSGDTDALNPFFVSFVAIVSGMFVTEAYQLIARAARGVLPTMETEEGERWGFGLKDAMAAQGISVEQMAGDLNRPVTDIQDWIDETKPLSAMDQSIVAAYLRTRARLLFTAEGPPEKSEPPQADPPPSSADQSAPPPVNTP